MPGKQISLSLAETNQLRSTLGLSLIPGHENAAQRQACEPCVENNQGTIDIAPQIVGSEQQKTPPIDLEEIEVEMDPVKWVNRMRELESERRQNRHITSTPIHNESEYNAQKLKFNNKVKLKTGETLTLSMADAHVLNGSNEDVVVLEDRRAIELERYKKHARERRKISDYRASAGATGVSSMVFSDADEEETSQEEELGLRLAGDEDTISTVNITSKGQTLSVSTEEKPKKRECDDLRINPKPPETSLEPKFKKRKKKNSSSITCKVDWNDIFDKSDPNLNISAESQFKMPEQWRFACDESDSEQIDSVFSLLTTERVDLALPEIKTVKKEEVNAEENAVVMSKVSEFAKSLQTPLEKLEEQKHVKRESEQRRGVITSAANVIVTEAPHVDAVVEQESVEGGLVSTLKYLKDTGNLNEEKWSLGRYSKDRKLPLHKSVNEGDVKLDYVDPWGCVMGPKEAFCQMSYRFHGKGPGKRKMEKKLKKMALARTLKTKKPEEVLPTLQALKAQQEKGEAYLVLTNTDKK